MRPPRSWADWLHVIPVVSLVLGLMTYWFAVADRYIIFLYFHDMGPLYSDTSPFSAVTSSRYWMTGLVATGTVMVFYTAINWEVGRWRPAYQPPAWWLVWLWCALPLLAGIPLIVMTVNQPTLPILNALQVTLATLVSLVLALVPGGVAARRPGYLLGLIFDGAALMLVLYFSSKLELVFPWLAAGYTMRVWLIIGGIAIGGAGLLLVTAVRHWLRTRIPDVPTLLMAALAVLLLMPLAHHLFVGGIEHHFYISDSANFFADTFQFEAMALFLTAVVAWLVTRLRLWLASHRAAHSNSFSR
jgi:hypothetical protein